MGPEEIPAAGGAQAADINVLRGQAGAQQPLAVEPRQVHMPLDAPALQIGGGFCSQGGGHGLRYVIVRLKAARTDAGAHGGHHGRRIGAEGISHGLNGFFQDPGGAAPPSGVDGACGVVDGIIEQHDAAVGGEYHQGKVGFPGDKGIGGVVPGGKESLSGIGGGAQADRGLMDLLGKDCPLHGNVQGAAEAPVIFQHSLRGIPPAGAQIQRVPGRGTDAALPGGKSVGDGLAMPGEQGRGEPYQAVLLMGRKGHRHLRV